MKFIIIPGGHVFFNLPSFETEDEAVTAAELLAGKNPGTDYHVFEQVARSESEKPPEVVLPATTTRIRPKV